MTLSLRDRPRCQAPGHGRLRRALLVFAAAAILVPASAATAQTFRVVTPSSGLPSYETPNEPGAVAMPFSLSTPPRTPETRSYEQLLALWQRAGEDYGVPWQVLAAINKIESNFGGNMGPSTAGAVGWMQFMPETWMRWGMDADGNGVADPWNADDAIYSAARYLAAAGAHEDLERAVFAYNHAQWYVDDVLELAASFGDGVVVGSSHAVWELADVDRQLGDARRAIVRLRTAIERTEERLEELATLQLAAENRVGNPALTDDEFRRAEHRVVELAALDERARVRLDRLGAALEEAVAALQALRERQGSAALAGAPLDGAAPASTGDYVFPVGGGPGAVSVAHQHHDYPAADIAAPEGSPLYALTDSVVTEVYPDGNGKCGIGFKLRTESGIVFVYCHLSYLEPDVVPGAALSGGAPVGLVGSTGNSTGPHLHLAFDPAAAYPQDEPWFESFAGVAFSWQDAPTPKRAAAPALRGSGKATGGQKRVFRVVRTRVVHFTR
jgi:murein DD-endopeptidase MepM/ murein hydrolase activator NlpD